ncbi:hypothetical protein [Virgibacillus proomii]|nr:hypothetical protein [Virgibacillus proomii]
MNNIARRKSVLLFQGQRSYGSNTPRFFKDKESFDSNTSRFFKDK